LNTRKTSRLLIAFCAAAASGAAFAAHYGTSPPTAAATSLVLSISDQPSLCAASTGNCIETTGAVRAYPVADGDRITLYWSNDPDQVDGLIHLGKLYLPLDATTSGSIAPVTLEIDLPTDTAATVVVEYAGTRHHVPLAPRAWQPITLYNPDERIIYLRLDLPGRPPPN
jgi:hypothetical protein